MSKTSGIWYQELRGEEARERILKWWRSLQEGGGMRAKLKRCATPAEAILHPETYWLLQNLPWASPEAAATIAGILAHIKAGEGDNASLGVKLALPKEKNGRIPLSESRFRQLLSSRTWDEFYRTLRRAIQVLEGQINPLAVADIILRWDKEQRGKEKIQPGKSLRFDLSNDYYLESIKHESKQKGE